MKTRALRRIVTRVRLRVERARLEYVFLLIALAWGVAQVFLVPPLQVPDEGDHWFRAWALTDGQLTADRQGMITLPGVFTRSVDLYTRLVGTVGALPISLEGQPGFSGYGDLFNGPGPSDNTRVVSRVASYGPLGYLPQAAGVGLGRLVGAPPLVCFYLARLGNLFASVVLLFFAIRLAPFGKQLFVLLALLPTTMFELASVSCDALTISGAMFFTSLLLWASARVTLRRIEVALVLLAAALLLNVKPGYEALVLLVLLVRPRQVGGSRRYLAFAAASTLLVVGIFLAIFWLTAIDARAPAVGGAHAQLLFILQQPMDFLGIVWANVSSQWTNWTTEGIGALGWLTVTLPPVLYVVVLEAGAVAFMFMGGGRGYAARAARPARYGSGRGVHHDGRGPVCLPGANGQSTGVLPRPLPGSNLAIAPVVCLRNPVRTKTPSNACTCWSLADSDGAEPADADLGLPCLTPRWMVPRHRSLHADTPVRARVNLHPSA